MKKIFLILTAVLLTAFLLTSLTWGFFGHKKINRLAVFTLPPEMVTFYKKHIDYLAEHAVDADKRRYAVKDEAARHYIDIDHYGSSPFDSVPKKWKNAVAKYTEDTLMAYGIVPWYVEKMTWRLTEAFKDENAERVLYLSSNLGHYIADAHVPLHTTENYNGQLTNQHGIHGFWESRLPELYAENWDFFTGRAEYISNINEKIWKIVKESYHAKDSVLNFETQLNRQFPVDKKYAYEKRGNKDVKVYSEEYSKAYNKMLDGMVERRMRSSIVNVGSFWYTAWVNAGKPDLNRLLSKEISDSLKTAEKETEKMWKTGQPPKGHEEEE